MEPERWRQVEEVFQAALECDPGQRSAFLDSACEGDTLLREEVESLLASHHDHQFTEASAFEEGIQLLERDQSLSGRRIGPYRVIREIGEGGMGAVYLAARADDVFEKQVAIKVIPRGLDTQSIIQHFHAERQILASLEHPNITRLLDGGATEDGLQYLVMEYVKGQPIDQYCEENKLSILERLRLFQSVCAAVHYAHQNLIIHRDIKAANVLVTEEGVPMLLDFGIAKLLAHDTGGESTMTAMRWMTPEYASPEQVRGEPVTTTTDVYSLGVLLYELLARRRPYQLTGKPASEVDRIICEEEPEKPSAASPAQIRALRGDLDNIVRMAMHKEPQHRYGSVEQFSADIRRHLDGLPVIARRDTAGYRAAKFIVRHKAGVAAAALLVVTLAAGIVATVWQARLARIETAKAQQISAFLQDMLSFSSLDYASPNSNKNPDVKMSEVVEQAAKRAETELADQPAVLVEVQRTIGGVYLSQGRYDEAERILRRCLERTNRLYGDESHQSAGVLRPLASTVLEKGARAEAEALFRKAIEIERKQARRGHLDVRSMGHALADYGSMLENVEDNAAGPYLREALQYATKFTGKDRGSLAMLYNDLGLEADRHGDRKESERMYRAAIDEYRKLPGIHGEMGVALANLGAQLIAEGRYDKAEPFVREALELRRKVWGDAHPDTAGGWHRLSDLLYSKGDYQGAEKASREAIAVFRRAQQRPEDNIKLATPLTELGMILNRMGRASEAEVAARQAVEIRVRVLPLGHRLIASSKAALGESLRLQKRYADAEPILLESYKILKSTFGDQAARTKEARQSLKSLYLDWHKPEKAASY
jgi:serine/threonine-protein kinase